MELQRKAKVTAGFLHRAGAESPLNFRETSEFFPERFWKISLRWIPKPQFWYPLLSVWISRHRIPKHLFFWVFWVSTAAFGFLPGDEKFWIFFLRCSAVHDLGGSQHAAPYKNPTAIKPLQQLKGKIVSALFHTFHTFPHFTPFQNFCPRTIS